MAIKYMGVRPVDHPVNQATQIFLVPKKQKAEEPSTKQAFSAKTKLRSPVGVLRGSGRRRAGSGMLPLVASLTGPFALLRSPEHRN